jgi:hypothetical protein
MTRTTDDLNPERFLPLGVPIRKPAPSAPAAPAPKPVGEYGVTTDAAGRFVTTKIPPQR